MFFFPDKYIRISKKMEICILYQMSYYVFFIVLYVVLFHQFVCCIYSLYSTQINQGEDHHRPCLLSNPLIHMYVLCMYVCMLS